MESHLWSYRITPSDAWESPLERKGLSNECILVKCKSLRDVSFRSMKYMIQFYILIKFDKILDKINSDNCIVYNMWSIPEVSNPLL